MADEGLPNDGTSKLPEGFSEALARYDEWLLIDARTLARRGALEHYPQFKDQWLIQFSKEDLEKQRADRAFANSRYERRTHLGAGGQGEVWLARDAKLGRPVALKVLKDKWSDSTDATQEFWNEAEITIQLAHPNIMPVYDADRPRESDDQELPYYVMPAFCNRHLMRAIAKFDARPRQDQDWKLFTAIKEFHGERTPESEKFLDEALNAFSFDDSQECDRELREAVEALRKDRTNQSGRVLEQAIANYHASGRAAAELRELLTRFIDVCDAITYAHSRGVIHRDLKPENIMLGEFGETLVADWGIAKIVGRDGVYKEESDSGTVRFQSEHRGAGETEPHLVKGTPRYMSPEQARHDPLSSRTDVYGLGAILYMILTGQPLRKGKSPRELVQLASINHFVNPTAVVPSIPKPLEAICLKALETSPEQRYTTARELSDDVGRWLADEPVWAHPESAKARVLRMAKNHPGVVGSLVSAVIVVIASVALLLFLRNIDQDQKAEEQRIAAEGLRLLTDNLFAALMEAGTSSLDSGKLVEARQSFERARETADALAKADPNDSRPRVYLAEIYNKLGHVSLAEYQSTRGGAPSPEALSSAIEFYERSIASRHQLSLESQESAVNLKGLYLTHVQLAIAYAVRGEASRSSEHSDAAETLLFKLRGDGHLAELASAADEIMHRPGCPYDQLISASRACCICLAAEDDDHEQRPAWTSSALYGLQIAMRDESADPSEHWRDKLFAPIRSDLRFVMYLSGHYFDYEEAHEGLELYREFVSENQSSELAFADDLTLIASELLTRKGDLSLRIEALTRAEEHETAGQLSVDATDVIGFAEQCLRESLEIRQFNSANDHATSFTRWLLGGILLDKSVDQASGDTTGGLLNEAMTMLNDEVYDLMREHIETFSVSQKRLVCEIIRDYLPQVPEDEIERWNSELLHWTRGSATH